MGVYAKVNSIIFGNRLTYVSECFGVFFVVFFFSPYKSLLELVLQSKGTKSSFFKVMHRVRDDNSWRKTDTLFNNLLRKRKSLQVV